MIIHSFSKPVACSSGLDLSFFWRVADSAGLPDSMLRSFVSQCRARGALDIATRLNGAVRRKVEEGLAKIDEAVPGEEALFDELYERCQRLIQAPEVVDEASARRFCDLCLDAADTMERVNRSLIATAGTLDDMERPPPEEEEEAQESGQRWPEGSEERFGKLQRALGVIQSMADRLTAAKDKEAAFVRERERARWKEAYGHRFLYPFQIMEAAAEDLLKFPFEDMSEDEFETARATVLEVRRVYGAAFSALEGEEEGAESFVQAVSDFQEAANAFIAALAPEHAPRTGDITEAVQRSSVMRRI